MTSGQVLTLEELLVWLHMAKHGDRLIYYMGDLAVAPNMGRIKRALMGAFDTKQVALFQKRLDDHVYQYIAVRMRDEEDRRSKFKRIQYK